MKKQMTLSLLLTASLFSTQTVSAATDVTVNPAVTPPKFAVPTTYNMQGLAYYKGYYYIGYDIKNGYGVIEKYNRKGQLMSFTKPLPTGHTAELDFRNANGHLYAANGGGKAPVKIYEIDYSTQQIVKTLDMSRLGNAGLIAIDNGNDRMIIHSAASDTSRPKFTTTDFNGRVIRQISIPYQGIPQGLEYKNKKIYYYTNNKITVISDNGTILKTYPLSFAGESEGMTIVSGTQPFMAVGYNKNNRLYELK